jgi:hypothetical protein
MASQSEVRVCVYSPVAFSLANVEFGGFLLDGDGAAGRVFRYHTL